MVVLRLRRDRRPPHRRALRRRPRAVLALALVLFAACSSEGREGTQPAPGVTTFEQGRFDDLPTFPRSTPLGPRSEKQGVVARSFRATGATPAQVLGYYERALDDWIVLDSPHRVGTSDYRGTWATDDYTLLISSAPAPGVDQRYETVTQYSLTLSPK